MNPENMYMKLLISTLKEMVECLVVKIDFTKYPMHQDKTRLMNQALKNLTYKYIDNLEQYCLSIYEESMSLIFSHMVSYLWYIKTTINELRNYADYNNKNTYIKYYETLCDRKNDFEIKFDQVGDTLKYYSYDWMDVDLNNYKNIIKESTINYDTWEELMVRFITCVECLKLKYYYYAYDTIFHMESNYLDIERLNNKYILRYDDTYKVINKKNDLPLYNFIKYYELDLY